MHILFNLLLTYLYLIRRYKSKIMIMTLHEAQIELHEKQALFSEIMREIGMTKGKLPF